MGNFISFEERKVIAKGLNPKNAIDQEVLQSYVFDEDFANFPLLDHISTFHFEDKPLLFYPGCGVDIIFPLIYFEKIFPAVKEAEFLFVDQFHTLGQIKTVLDDLGISFEESRTKVSFYWKDQLIHLRFIQANIFEILHGITYDIYFERAFRIMKDPHPGYESLIFENLRSGGILISDSGFQTQNLKKIDVPSSLSAYKEMIIGKKEAASG